MNIHLNWGNKLLIAIVIFMSFIFVLVYLSAQNQIDLVEKDYYPKGLKYQDRIDEIENWHYSNQLRHSPTLGKLLMWGAPPSLFWGSYGPWYKLTNSELYIGVRMKIDTEYKFGWIKVKVYSRESFEILSYAIEI